MGHHLAFLDSGGVGQLLVFATRMARDDDPAL